MGSSHSSLGCADAKSAALRPRPRMTSFLLSGDAAAGNEMLLLNPPPRADIYTSEHAVLHLTYIIGAFARHTNKLKDRPQPLKHAFKYACLQQSSAKSSGWNLKC
ncbi:uncharacterized protein [Miscanthus floridulus]|uniref:uncharacterized protein isoform X2 n=1 Tax=Miscanthus floridulus TaxID=154761 RepID=UPI003457FD17